MSLQPESAKDSGPILPSRSMQSQALHLTCRLKDTFTDRGDRLDPKWPRIDHSFQHNPEQATDRMQQREPHIPQLANR